MARMYMNRWMVNVVESYPQSHAQWNILIFNVWVGGSKKPPGQYHSVINWLITVLIPIYNCIIKLPHLG